MDDALELRNVSRTTLAHYDANARSFWEGTRDHDVSQNIEALLARLGPAPQRILDLGCGPGRDLAALRALGHEPVGLDGAARFVEMARAHSGCPVLHQDFLALEPPASHGVMLVNPPYGVRLGHSEKSDALYAGIGDRLKQRWAGWRVHVFTGDPRLKQSIGLRPFRRIPLYNGPLECRLYEFKMVEGSIAKYRKANQRLPNKLEEHFSNNPGTGD